MRIDQGGVVNCPMAEGDKRSIFEKMSAFGVDAQIGVMPVTLDVKLQSWKGQEQARMGRGSLHVHKN